MIFAIAQFIAKLTGFDISKVQRVVLWILIGVVLFSVLLFGYCVTGWFKRSPKLDSKAIEKAQQAIAVQDRKVMVEILAESDAKEAVADGIVNNAKAETINKEAESKAKWNQATDAEIQAELIRRAQ